jgi:predicted DCC family thiol-disulfide oxidoreductase YuxK
MARRLLSSAASRQLVMLYDGSCPLCVREVAFLRRLRRADRVVFTDICAPSFSAEPYGRSVAQLTDEMHVYEPATMKLHVRVPAFRVLYRVLVGVDVLAFTAFWPMSLISDVGYGFIARHKHRLAWLFAP